MGVASWFVLQQSESQDTSSYNRRMLSCASLMPLCTHGASNHLTNRCCSILQAATPCLTRLPHHWLPPGLLLMRVWRVPSGMAKVSMCHFVFERETNSVCLLPWACSQRAASVVSLLHCMVHSWHSTWPGHRYSSSSMPWTWRLQTVSVSDTSVAHVLLRGWGGPGHGFLQDRQLVWHVGSLTCKHHTLELLFNTGSTVTTLSSCLCCSPAGCCYCCHREDG